jgi:hypothetical protein
MLDMNAAGFIYSIEGNQLREVIRDVGRQVSHCWNKWRDNSYACVEMEIFGEELDMLTVQSTRSYGTSHRNSSVERKPHLEQLSLQSFPVKI